MPWSFFPEAITSTCEACYDTEAEHSKIPTTRNVQFRCKRNLLVDLGYAACTRTMQEPFEVEAEDRRELIDMYRLRRIQRSSEGTDLYKLWRRNVREGSSDRVDL